MMNRANHSETESADKITRLSRGKRKLIKRLNRYGKKLVLANAISFK